MKKRGGAVAIVEAIEAGISLGLPVATLPSGPSHRGSGGGERELRQTYRRAAGGGRQTCFKNNRFYFP